MTQSTTSHYLSVLQRAGLVHATRLGKWTYYKRNEEAIKQLASYIQQDLYILYKIYRSIIRDLRMDIFVFQLISIYLELRLLHK
jgi:DNA-binding transcriptional ArsR family regulator